MKPANDKNHGKIFVRGIRRIMKRVILLITLFLFATASPSLAWEGLVVGVHDGDTITVIHDGRSQKVRIYGIDCPELGQYYGEEAKKATHEMIYGKRVEVEEIDKDQYGRTVAVVKIGNKNVSEELVKNGYAYVYRKYCNRPECQEWSSLEEKAKESGRGFWAVQKLTPPEKYRKLHRKRKAFKPRRGLMSRKEYEEFIKHSISPKAMMSYEDYVYYYSQPRRKLRGTITMPGVGIYDWPYEKVMRTFYRMTWSDHGWVYHRPSGSSYGTIYAPIDKSKPVHVRGYYRSDGTYVRPYTRRRPHR